MRGCSVGCLPIQGTLRACWVMIEPPYLNCTPRAAQAEKPMLVQAFITRFSDETLDKRVRNRPPRRKVPQLSAAALGPTHQALLMYSEALTTMIAPPSTVPGDLGRSSY